MFTNYGKLATSLRMGSSVIDVISNTGIGTGSGTAAVTDESLIDEVNRVVFTTSPDYSEARKVTVQSDFSSVAMSGIQLTEFGITSTGSNTNFTGSYWQRESFSEIEFDGSIELQILTSIEVL